jgi:hypothetical protein
MKASAGAIGKSNAALKGISHDYMQKLNFFKSFCAGEINRLKGAQT